ncbi:MAG: hypothetical protein IIC95_00020 [Chloroflexi bacterium]|nr:hypothetical protein [Chloroflexota bacterium]
MQTGDQVALRAYGGETLVRRVVAVGERTVLVCSEEEYLQAKAEMREPVSVGFPMTEVIDVVLPSAHG